MKAKLRKQVKKRLDQWLKTALEISSAETLRLAAETDSEGMAVMELLASPEMLTHLRRGDPIIEPRLRGPFACRAMLLADGGCVTVKGAKQFIPSANEKDIEKLIIENKLIFIWYRKILLPIWQFKKDGSGPIDGLDQVLDVLKKRGEFGWDVFQFFQIRDIDLNGQSRIEALSRGEKDTVLLLASREGEQGG